MVGAPQNNAERIQIAYRAYEKALHATSTRLFREAFVNDLELVGDRQLQHRYNAACAAAIAGCGKSQDNPPPDDSSKTKLRQQALEWLEAELATYSKLVERTGIQQKGEIAKILEDWKIDSDLNGVRDQKELEALPQAERTAFQKLWADVDRLLVKTKSP